jgi:hypothetical protein
MAKRAAGKHAFGFSDRSGKRYPLSDLVEQYENLKPTGLMVGKDELDIDHEQLQIGRVDSSDSQTLDNPRPDTSRAESNALWAWNPVGGGITEFGSSTVGLDIKAEVGQVTVSVS